MLAAQGFRSALALTLAGLFGWYLEGAWVIEWASPRPSEITVAVCLDQAGAAGRGVTCYTSREQGTVYVIGADESHRDRQAEVYFKRRLPGQPPSDAIVPTARNLVLPGLAALAVTIGLGWLAAIGARFISRRRTRPRALER